MTEHPVTPRELRIDDRSYRYYPLDTVASPEQLGRMPLCIKLLLENLLRQGAGGSDSGMAQLRALAHWPPDVGGSMEIAFAPARVVLQDFTGVPAIVDLAAMRDALETLGGDPRRINPQVPVDLVIDHSVQVDAFGSASAQALNTRREYERNGERYAFLRWGQRAFDNFSVVPPGTGIVHQVNLEYLARVVVTGAGEPPLLYPDTLVGTDSHTTMINGLGILGWGVGGIEAEAAMLGQPITMRIPEVVGVRLEGELPAGATATDLVLRVTQMLREHGVVGKFVEFFGDGLARLPVADRATIANMAPEYGATCGLFPIDGQTLAYLRLTGRSDAQIARVEAYTRAQGLFRDDGDRPLYSETLALDLGGIEPSLAGPRRPQDRLALRDAARAVARELESRDRERGQAANRETEIARFRAEGGGTAVAAAERQGAAASTGPAEADFELRDGAVVLAAVTSCTNTSNPSVMLAAGLLARNARARGLRCRPWVKTSLAPGSQVVRDYLDRAGVSDDLDALGFQIVGYGCTTCIGNSGPLPETVAAAIREGDLTVCSVLSGNRNFEGRIHPDVRLNYLASPPLVIAYAIAGSMRIDLLEEPLGSDSGGAPVYLHELWPTPAEVSRAIADTIDPALFRERYADVHRGDASWNALPVPESERYRWDAASTYIRRPPFFEELPAAPAPLGAIAGARVLCLLGDSVTTDHISPAGAIAADSPAGRHLREQGIDHADFNSYGSRRGNHEVMLRGTFANPRLRNRLAPGTEGGWTRMEANGEVLSIHEAARRYAASGTPLLVIAGRDYGSGSSRDWAAKGPRLLGVRAVIAESFERIHRSNLVGMGVLPLQFGSGHSAGSLGLDGSERFDIPVPERGTETVEVRLQGSDGAQRRFTARVRIDTPQEWEYFRHGGILQAVLRDLASGAPA